jgi:hypothetical protein
VEGVCSWTQIAIAPRIPDSSVISGRFETRETGFGDRQWISSKHEDNWARSDRQAVYS